MNKRNLKRIMSDNWLDGIMGVMVSDALAGLYYGYDSIPGKWLSVIQRREWIEEMCRDC